MWLFCCANSIHMNSRFRIVSFTILLVAISCFVIIQSISMTQALVAHVGMGTNVLRSVGVAPLQATNATSSSIQNSTMSSNSTALGTLTSSGSMVAGANVTASVSALQFQVNSLSAQVGAMSSSMQSMSQDTGNNTVIAEAGLIVGILALIAAIAVARRGDAMYRETNQPNSPQAKQ